MLKTKTHKILASVAVVVLLYCIKYFFVFNFHGFEKHNYIALSIGESQSVSEIFTTSYVKIAPSYRPLAKFYYKLQWKLFGCNTKPMYIMNLMIWMTIAFLLFGITFSLTKSYFYSTVTAILPLSHDGGSQIVWLTSSHNAFANLTGILSLWIYFNFFEGINLIRRNYYILILFLICMSPLFKEFGIIYSSFFGLIFLRNISLYKKWDWHWLFAGIFPLIVYTSLRVILASGALNSIQSYEEEMGNPFMNIWNGLLGVHNADNPFLYTQITFIILAVFMYILAFKSKMQLIKMLPLHVLMIFNATLCFLENRSRNQMPGFFMFSILLSYYIFLNMEEQKKYKYLKVILSIVIFLSLIGPTRTFLRFSIRKKPQMPIRSQLLYPEDINDTVTACFQKKYKAHSRKEAK